MSIYVCMYRQQITNDFVYDVVPLNLPHQEILLIQSSFSWHNFFSQKYYRFKHNSSVLQP